MQLPNVQRAVYTSPPITALAVVLLDDFMRDLFALDDSDERSRLSEAWQKVVIRLAEEVSPAWFARFIQPLRAANMREDIVTIEASSKFVIQWVSDKYLGTISDYLSEELGHPVRAEFTYRGGTRPEMGEEAVTVATGSSGNRAFIPNRRYTFENYVVGDSNRLAVAGAKAVAAEPGDKYNPLFIYGPNGLGKTHLLHSIAAEIQRSNPKKQVAYITAQTFAEEFIMALQQNRMDQFRRSQRHIHVWLLDDVQFVAGKDKTQEEIFHTFTALHQSGAQMVMCADRPPRDLTLFDERLKSRMEAGLVADVNLPDTETRAAILLSKAGQDSIHLDPEVADYLATNVVGNIRNLEGALTRLSALASLDDGILSLDRARRMVEEHYRNSFRKPTFDEVLALVSHHYGIPVDDIKGATRKAPIVHARHVAIYLHREISTDSWKHIGTLLGNRDHTSIMHAYTKINEMLHIDRDFRAEMKSLFRTLSPNK